MHRKKQERVYTLISMGAYSSSRKEICEGENCEAITNVKRYVKEMKLCDDCASKEGYIGKARKGREKYDGRIDGYDGEWKLIDKINVNEKIPCQAILGSYGYTLVGCIDECNVIITDNALHTYTLDINTKDSQRVITTQSNRVTLIALSCASLNDDKIVVGKYCKGCKMDSLNGLISVYDRQWKHINDVTIPKQQKTFGEAGVDVAVDQDGMIIAAEPDQSKVYVINPADNKIMNTITCKDKILLFDVLSSGHILARPFPLDHRVFIIDRQGAQREIPHSNDILYACIDPITDDLYVVTLDDGYDTCVIDQVTSGGYITKKRAASFPLSTGGHPFVSKEAFLMSSRVMMTSSGKLIASDGDNILVFKNRFTP